MGMARTLRAIPDIRRHIGVQARCYCAAAVRIPIFLYVLALVARLAMLAGFADPGYPDSFYYVDVARQLAAGHGFSVDFVWIFVEVGGHIPAVPVLPIASNAHWLPLASIVQVPFIWLLGPTAFASGLPFALIGAAAAPLTWAIGRDANMRPAVALGAAVMAAVPGLLLVFMAQPDNFALFQTLVAGSLWLAGRGMRGRRWSFAAAGLLAGLATLSRTEGMLVLGVLGLTFLWDRWRSRRASGDDPARPARIPLAAALGAVALFVLAAGPWFARQIAVFGSMSPSTSTGKVLLIRSMSEWDSIDTPATLDHLLGMGIGPLLATRVTGLLSAVVILVVFLGTVVLMPPMVAGAWARRRDAAFGPFFGYAAALFAFSAILTSIHVPGGMFIHSAVGLAPQAYLLMFEGIGGLVVWAGRRRSGWDPAPAGRRLFTAAVAVGFAAAIVGSQIVHQGWSATRERMTAVASALDAAAVPATDRIMSFDASGTRYWTGRGGVVLVNDPIATVKDVAVAYNIRWLVLELGQSVPAAAPILAGGPLPGWLGPPILDRADVKLYPVCTTAGDARCAVALQRLTQVARTVAP